ncbi:MAG TPA: fluoride efflux transporter CrcB [Kofleriaceae bacterium]|nr:fluoride efflux transporter CrcB [Kofleriaceae bacterium]
MQRLLIVIAAGGIGCGVRYLVALWIGPRAFPYATLAVNLAGCFLIALILESVLRGAAISPNLKLALTTGFMGGLTTYSSFNYESTSLAAEDQTSRALLYVGVTLIGCVLCGLAGIWVARRLT